MIVIQLPRRFVKSHWGGTETVILETSKRLLKMGHQTEIVCPNMLSPQESETIDGVSVKRVPYFYPYWGLSRKQKLLLDKKGGNAFSFALMKTLLDYPQLDILHLHTGNRIGGIGRYVARKRNIPYVVSLHGGVYDVPAEESSRWESMTEGALEWGKALGWWVGSRQVLQDAAAIICVGKGEQQKIQQKFPDKRVIYLPNGVNTQQFARGDGLSFRRLHNIDLKAKVILMVGRIDPQKNQLAALRVLSLLRKHRDYHSHLVMIGPVTNDDYYQQVLRTIKEYNLERFVTIIPGLLPDSKELVDAYHASNLFFLPSIHEPFGIVVLEAWTAGLPVVASSVGGLCHLMHDKADGLLCTPGNDEGFFQAIDFLIKHPKIGYEMSALGRWNAHRKYDWSRITNKLANIYDDVLRKPTTRPFAPKALSYQTP